jgi:hypothetical protein
MHELRTIEIDFDIYKKIEAERRDFSEPQYVALRRLLGLPAADQASKPQPAPTVGRARPWSGEGVLLPHGTQIRMTYNGRMHSGEIADGKWIVDGKEFDSPSGAASGVAMTKRGRRTRLDGWIYWEVKLPGEANWQRLSALRSATSARVLTGHDL